MTFSISTHLSQAGLEIMLEGHVCGMNNYCGSAQRRIDDDGNEEEEEDEWPT